MLRVSRITLFGYGFRPFFLAAGWFALAGVGGWLWLRSAGVAWPGGLPASQWHGHEMLFGFVGAAIAGFMLTAVPSWTGSRGFAGWPLAALSLVWLLGRMAFALAGYVPLGWVAALELAFLPGLALLIAPGLLRSRNRNTRLLFVLLALWITDAVFVWAAYRSNPALADAGLQFALNVVLLLITVIGGRIVPAFTANALRRRGLDFRMRSRQWVERGVIVAMLAVLVTDATRPGSALAAAVALAAGTAHAVRLSGWNGHKTLREPIVWILHVAYAWLAVGFFLKAAFFWGGYAWAAFWVHALGAGAAGTMILAVMSRAALGHTGRPLQAAPALVGAYGLLFLAALVRVFGPAWAPFGYENVIRLAGSLWLGAFALFVAVYTPILLHPRVDAMRG